MSTKTELDLSHYTQLLAQQARAASRKLVSANGNQKNDWLRRMVELIQSRTPELLAANEQDIRRAPDYGLTEASIDRLRLTEARLQGIVTALEEITALPNPIGEIIGSNMRPNGLLVTQVRVPLGVVFFIYESRPNVTIDAAALCVKSGNAVILRGGKEAFHSNMALYGLLQQGLKDVGLPEQAVQLVETTDREAVGQFLKLSEYIDVTIPRGGKGLIERVARDATMPVIKHFDGICHVYLDKSADPDASEAITVNSKCQRPGVCNAAESLLVHADIAGTIFPRVAGALIEQGVELRCCPKSMELVSGTKAATEEDYGTEYGAKVMSVKIVNDIDEAISHIHKYGSGHTESIVATELAATEKFTTEVDSAAVIVNASTRFNDGGEFGLGAEIGISTDKFHARGPCGLVELTSYKYVAHGAGQIRE
ncbi:MAG: glutamate-5-semialdehyde dehydrogenase [Planctomycetes bacterium]|nr:glutamate-5-semialdehyde dehydrogenase [Planctomycetota bacterium]MCH9726238.1 glutamate-5-semialdehyde dehydrogenase [Planctomycetota bacterium]MCH9775743.1 glutamate-5-semialdehyde dehydrogenase [Planctomycetota bacterium]MCH9791781.1 glutamate-5-semialdehyde dehydrogenase [Planctomycetota bacterium]